MSKYAFQNEISENMAKACAKNLPFSTKHAIEICNFLRSKKVARVKAILERVKELKQPVPFKRFTEGCGHRKGNMLTGAYPEKAAGFILKVIQSAESNAINKGLNSSNLVVKHICANRGMNQFRQGRKGRARFKRTHIEIVVEEVKNKETTKKTGAKE
jgi:large subunit ribosomal protein L22